MHRKTGCKNYLTLPIPVKQESLENRDKKSLSLSLTAKQIESIIGE
jgi:hypothetical protein